MKIHLRFAQIPSAGSQRCWTGAGRNVYVKVSQGMFSSFHQFLEKLAYVLLDVVVYIDLHRSHVAFFFSFVTGLSLFFYVVKKGIFAKSLIRLFEPPVNFVMSNPGYYKFKGKDGCYSTDCTFGSRTR